MYEALESSADYSRLFKDPVPSLLWSGNDEETFNCISKQPRFFFKNQKVIPLPFIKNDLDLNNDYKKPMYTHHGEVLECAVHIEDPLSHTCNKSDGTEVTVPLHLGHDSKVSCYIQLSNLVFEELSE